MKKLIQVFPRHQFTSAAAGAAQSFNHDPSLIAQLGAADEVLWEVAIYSATQNARVKLTPYHGARPEFRPAAALGGAALTALTLSSPTQGVSFLDTAVTFSGRLEGVLTIDATTGTAVESADLEINATLIFR
jgi:hypothetical protein